MPLLLFFLHFFIFHSSQAEETIRFQAANTSMLRDVNHGLHFANFVKHKSKYLEVTPFKSLLVSKKKCQVACVKELQCLSFNIAALPNFEGQFKCELLASDMFISSTNLTDNVSYHHYSIKTDCSDNGLCRNGGSCIPHYSTNSYSCQCPCPYNGQHCQKAIVKQWSSWSECSLDNNCMVTKNRTRDYSHPELVSSVCPGRTDVNQEEKICTPNETFPPGCESPVGVEDGRISNAQMTASSLIYHWWPHHARLNKFIGHYGSWAPDMSKPPPHYLAIDLGTLMHITKVATQGTPKQQYLDVYYTTLYSLQYSTDNAEWTDYLSSQCIKTLPGNTNSNGVVTNTLQLPIKARYVRFIVKEYTGQAVLRVELYGCPV